VGGTTSKHFKTLPHRVPMLSLDNTYSLEELEEFDQRVHKGLGAEKYEYVCELKIDGVSMELVYEEGILVHALTRGDGEKGDDVIENVKMIRGLPHQLKGINIPKRVEIRGEVFLHERILRKLTRKGKNRMNLFSPIPAIRRPEP
jgi:DNA ligase (NAD+)